MTDSPDPNALDTGLILQLSATGLFIGAGTVFGWIGAAYELWAWLVAAAIWIPIIVRRRPDRVFAHVFAVAVVSGFIVAGMQSFWFGTYLDNNPLVEAEYRNATQTLEGNVTADPGDEFPYRIIVVISGIVRGALFGTIMGLVGWYVMRVRSRRTAPLATGAMVQDEEE